MDYFTPKKVRGHMYPVINRKHDGKYDKPKFEVYSFEKFSDAYHNAFVEEDIFKTLRNRKLKHPQCQLFWDEPHSTLPKDESKTRSSGGFNVKSIK